MRSDVLLCKLRVSYTYPSHTHTLAHAHKHTHPTKHSHTDMCAELAPSSVLDGRGVAELKRGIQTHTRIHMQLLGMADADLDEHSAQRLIYRPTYPSTCVEMSRSIFCLLCVSYHKRGGIFFICTLRLARCVFAWLNGGMVSVCVRVGRAPSFASHLSHTHTQTLEH